MQEQLRLPEPPEEEWRPVVSWEGWYEVSSLGRVRRVKPNKGTFVGKILSNRARPGFYPTVILVRPPRHTLTRGVHLLVADAFLGPRPPQYEINHKDGNKHNARLDNLEFMTRKENLHHAWITGLSANHKHPVLRGTTNPMAKLTTAEILEIRSLELQPGMLGEVAKKYGVAKSSLSRIRTGKAWAHIKETHAH